MNLKRHIKSITLIFLFLISFLISIAQEIEEISLKCILIERFSRFIDWQPKSKQYKNKTTFRILIYGKTSLNSKIVELYSKSNIKNKPVIIKFINSIEELEDAEFLIIGKTTPQILNKIISFAYSNNIITIAENSNLESGIAINYIMVNNKVKFEVNNKTLKSLKVNVSYHLLEIAERVKK